MMAVPASYACLVVACLRPYALADVARDPGAGGHRAGSGPQRLLGRRRRRCVGRPPQRAGRKSGQRPSLVCHHAHRTVVERAAGKPGLLRCGFRPTSLPVHRAPIHVICVLVWSRGERSRRIVGRRQSRQRQRAGWCVAWAPAMGLRACPVSTLVWTEFYLHELDRLDLYGCPTQTRAPGQATRPKAKAKMTAKMKSEDCSRCLLFVSRLTVFNDAHRALVDAVRYACYHSVS